MWKQSLRQGNLNLYHKIIKNLPGVLERLKLWHDRLRTEIYTLQHFMLGQKFSQNWQNSEFQKYVWRALLEREIWNHEVLVEYE